MRRNYSIIKLMITHQLFDFQYDATLNEYKTENVNPKRPAKKPNKIL